MGENGGKYPSWKIVATALASLALWWITSFSANTNADIKDLKAGKVDKEQYCQDLQRIEKKIDKLIDMHMGP